jgi:two-component system, NarL family, nitrate/nitrite sensor histidine kinase NarX
MSPGIVTLGARKISTKLIVTQVVFLLVALGAIGLTLLVSWKLEGSAAAINDAGSLRMRAWRLAYLTAQDPKSPREVHEIERSIAEFESVFATLRRGDPARPLFLPGSPDVARQIGVLDERWNRLAAAMRRAARGAAPPRQAEFEDFVGVVNQLVVTVEEDIAHATEVLRYTQLALVGLVIGGAVIFMYLSFLVVIRPLSRLHEGIQQMAGGDLSARVSIESRDEFGQVTEGFNEMAERLEGIHRTLESRVEAKTRELAERTARIETLYDMGAFLNTPQPRGPMCEGFLARVQHSFGADASAVRLTAADGRLHFYAVRDVASSIVDEEHCLRVGECACGDAARRGKTLVRLVPREGPPLPLPYCREAGYQGVVATPIEAHGEMLGVFTLFFKEPREIGVEERHMLDTLGQHLGAALETARLGALEKEVAISEERNLLAQELHDSIAQSLAFINLQVQMLDSSMKQGDAGRSATTLGEIRDGVQECYGDVRELLNHFRTRLAPVDLGHALASMLASFERRTGIDTHLESTGSGLPLAPDRQLQALHVVQEALSNARKHASCTRVDVVLDSGREYVIRVRDDGCGFDPAQAAHLDDHVGLRIMRERAARAGGTVEIRSAPGAGTEVLLRVPAVEREVAA